MIYRLAADDMPSLGFLPSAWIKKQNICPKTNVLFFGGDNWNRTNDPLHVKQVL